MSWAELFFDLVFVFAVTEVSTLLEHDHSWAGALRALIVFVPVYWVWVGTTIQSDVSDMSGPGLRLVSFGVALCGMFMALAVPQAYRGRGMLLAFSYLAARLLLGLVIRLRAKWTINPVTVSMVLTGPVLALGALWHGSVREALWGVAALIDLGSPSLLRRRLSGMRFEAGHLAERFGQFVLIALGESVVDIGASAQSSGSLSFGVGGAVAAAFAVSCGLWWVYFNFAADAVRHALASAQVQLDIARRVLSYGHLAFIAAIIAVAVGLREAVTHPGTALSTGATGLVFGGAALYLASFGYTRWMMFRLVSVTRLTAGAVVLAAMWPCSYLPAVAALLVLAGILLGLNTVEWLRVAEFGWRTLFRQKAT